MNNQPTKEYPAGRNGRVIDRDTNDLRLISENPAPRQRWRPVMPPKKQIMVSPALAAFLRAMAQTGGAP
jgi:hypothetical protein